MSDRTPPAAEPVSTRDVVVIGGSAGSVEALTRIVAALPADLAAAVLVVVHFPPQATSVLPQILSRAGRLRAAHAIDGEPLQRGRIYVGPPDWHLCVEGEAVRLTQSARENGVRPCIDVLFRSAAASLGPRVIAVVLSGTLDDGTGGSLAVHARGGLVIVQDPADSLFPGMPESVIRNDTPDHVLPLDEIAPTLARLVREPAIGQPRADRPGGGWWRGASQPRVTAMEKATELTGPPSTFMCPECSGALWELRDGAHLRFQCHVGHAYSVESMYSEQANDLEHALWVALRALKDRAALSRVLAERSAGRGQHALASRYSEQALAAEERAAVVRRVIEGGLLLDPATLDAARRNEQAMTDERKRADREPPAVTGTEG